MAASFAGLGSLVLINLVYGYLLLNAAAWLVLPTCAASGSFATTWRCTAATCCGTCARPAGWPGIIQSDSELARKLRAARWRCAEAVKLGKSRCPIRTAKSLLEQGDTHDPVGERWEQSLGISSGDQGCAWHLAPEPRRRAFFTVTDPRTHPAGGRAWEGPLGWACELDVAVFIEVTEIGTPSAAPDDPQ